MPPKRKSKATKAVSTTPLRTPPASVMSNKRTGSVHNSLQGAKSRLAPSVPFQMTTRRGAKGTSNHTSPAGPSSASSGSRRSSLNEIAHYEDAPSDLEHEQPAKRSRTSTDSGSPQMSNGSFDNITPMNGTQTPELQKPASGATLTATKTAGKKRRASDDSTQSSKTLGPRQNGVLTRTQSDVSEQQPRRKKRKTTEVPADSADQPPELTDASTAPNSPEQIPDVDGSQSLQNVLPTNGDAPAKSGRRLPGRRRQPHPDINIETDLRRQLNLKMSYRSLAKVQKALLEELSNRTTNNLNKDPDFHTQCPAYEPLMAKLDQRRDGRLDQVNASRTCRLEQLERLRIAEERIQKEQYINRFQELQDDFLLQCYFRMKQIDRQMKGEKADATDDEDNILPPTYNDEPHHDVGDRIGSKYASRSRAYVEADRELEKDSIRRRFDQARIAFVEKDDDAEDSIEHASGGFARYTGPDRTEAVAHHNITSLADAALEVERMPSPQPETPRIPTIPNEHAALLMMLADLSAQQPRTTSIQESQYHNHHVQQQPPPPPPPPPRATTPVIEQKLTRPMSPVFAPPEIPLILPSQAAHSSSIKAPQPPVDLAQGSPRSEPNGVDTVKEVEVSRKATPARVSTHRIMDMLNDDQEVAVPRSRESQPPAQEPGTPSRREAASQHNTPSRTGTLPFDSSVHMEEPPVDQALMDALGETSHPPNNPPSSPPSNTQPWPRSSVGQPSDPEEALRRRDPLQKIRELLDRKAREHGREPPDRSHHWRGPELFRNTSSQNTQERSEVAGYDPQRPSTGLYDASPSAAPVYPSAHRRESSQDQGGHWERDRRMSGSQAPQQLAVSPYQSHTSQPYQADQNKPGPTPPTHQSPYALPPGSLPLPPKPPGPPPSGPVNFRFAHYDPAPPRQPYPPPSPSYPPASHPAHAPPPPQYASGYSGPPPYQGGYVPPPGSFQAPPPPSGIPSYPPLKIHQYGGQPILPANMAPPPQAGPPMTFVGQTAPPLAFSPPQGQPLGPHYEQRENHGERPPEPQSRPRRQYRSYHAPGTQFRSYQGPGETRRRGV